jgi:hypothetical protein
MTEHTSGQWQNESSSVYFGEPDTYEDNGTTAWGGFDLRYSPRSHANAAHIVKCVNQHYDLVEALTLLLHEVAESGNYCANDFGWPEAIIKSEKALAKANGEK